MFTKKYLLLTVILLISVHSKVLPQIEDKPVVISLKAITGLQYDLARFSVKPGAKVKLILTNSDDMPHNLLFTKPGTRQEVVDAALKLGEKGLELNYKPDLPSVLWSIPVLAPGESKTITFTAPEKTGVYPYVCTYPGHGFVMYGAMYVTKDEMPPLHKDLNVPPNRRDDYSNKNTEHGHTDHTPAPAHPYKETPPYLYRTFTDGSGPATIAVRLPGNLSYFWDAGTCRLRYATEGDFLNMKELWAGHRQAVAKDLGTVFFRDKTRHPFRIGAMETIPDVKFKGYRLLDRYPEFHYILNGLHVYELIKEKPDGTGLIRSFRIPDADRPVKFLFSPDDGVRYTFSSGKRSQNTVELTPAEAKQFTITMTKKEGEVL
ncbi:MAG TPA: plastocyanin/azurin family copper-binding protein [Sphingobacteriaceae bacterium]